MTVGADDRPPNIDKLRSDLRHENCKFLLQAIVAAAALPGPGLLSAALW
jgi:hypothetical protein